MIVKVNLFAAAKETLGASDVELTLDDAATLRDLKQTLVELHPTLAELVEKSAFSVDKEYATDQRALYHGAEVGLIPPVSGG